MLDFLNPAINSGAVLGSAQSAQPTQADQAASPALIIEMAKAMREQKQAQEAAAQKSTLSALHDKEGRKLGAVGTYVTLQGELRRARASANQAEIDRLEGLLADAEAGVDAFTKKSGLSRTQLLPMRFGADQAETDQAQVAARIAEIRSRHDVLKRQASAGGAPGDVYLANLAAQCQRSEAAMLALQAGLIQPKELAQAARNGVWALPLASQRHLDPV